ncbi:MAG: ATP-binding protein [Candidatus Aenigmatarchaeota archaeon]
MVWYERYGWTSNPFELKPKPDLISGFDEIREELLDYIKSGSCCLLLGKEGMGKTTLLKWLEKYAISEGIPLYINTSGMKGVELKQMDLDKLIKEKTGLLGKMLNKGKEIILLIDEAQDLPPLMGKAIKRSFDNNVIKAVVLASETDKLENLGKSLLDDVSKRKVKLRPMKQEEALNMIYNRVQFRNPFEIGSLDIIFNKAGYIPKDILELCEFLAKENQKTTLTKAFLVKYFEDVETEPDLEDYMGKFSPLQRKIINVLRWENARPSEIAAKLGKPTKTITGQLAYLGLKSRVEVMKRKGIEKPIVEKASEKPPVYRLTKEVRDFLGDN